VSSPRRPTHRPARPLRISTQRDGPLCEAWRGAVGSCLAAREMSQPFLLLAIVCDVFFRVWAGSDSFPFNYPEGRPHGSSHLFGPHSGNPSCSQLVFLTAEYSLLLIPVSFYGLSEQPYDFLSDVLLLACNFGAHEFGWCRHCFNMVPARRPSPSFPPLSAGFVEEVFSQRFYTNWKSDYRRNVSAGPFPLSRFGGGDEFF